MKAGWCLVLALAWFPSVQDAPGQSNPPVRLHVSETGGIRRTQFPVAARVPFPRGVLRDPARARLLLGQDEVAVQTAAESRWPDGTVQWLALDFNATIGATESQTYTLQFGEGVTAKPADRVLTAQEEGNEIRVGSIRLGTSGWPLVTSVKYRDEVIGIGVNGLVVTDTAGVSHDLSAAEGVTVEAVKRGPLVVVVHYAGAIRLGATAAAPFEIAVEMPNSKAWIKLSAVVTDPERRVRAIALATPLALGPAPWVWDFGTTRWTYGSMRAAADSVVMTHVRSATSATWTVMNGPKGREQVYETSAPDRATFAGWGHVQGAKEVVAFAVEGVPARIGTYRIALDGGGQATFGFTPASPGLRHELTVYEHFVSSPVQIGAATSPAAILSPLAAVCDRNQYQKSGVPVPPGVH
jgi:hypothetical protein